MHAQQPAVAQGYPAKPIRLIHGFGSGSAIDVFSRPLAQKLSESLGQQVVVDARPGATGMIANDLVAKSAPMATRCSRRPARRWLRLRICIKCRTIRCATLR